MMSLGRDWVVAWARLATSRVTDARTRLGDLDRAIGDGDHGENLDRGFSAVGAKLDDLPSGASPADALRLIATTLISNVGGAAGPLYGTAFLRAAESAGDKPELDSAAVAAMLTAARDGIVQRGRAEIDEKTMVDAWSRAVDAADAAVTAGATESAVLDAAADAAEHGAEATEPLVARKGRASYLGERAIGHRDPGAESSALILRAAADAAKQAR
jgi:dihydroxyacetone kinase-like protein